MEKIAAGNTVGRPRKGKKKKNIKKDKRTFTVQLRIHVEIAQDTTL